MSYYWLKLKIYCNGSDYGGKMSNIGVLGLVVKGNYSRELLIAYDVKFDICYEFLANKVANISLSL